MDNSPSLLLDQVRGLKTSQSHICINPPDPQNNLPN
ncbi:Uncharacterised protein [Yersinia intermedia]|nr:Uncharacterised protein [Yersinia intermedia]VDZ57858.1 Uncharacterised protein [Yersinia intermedia]